MRTAVTCRPRSAFTLVEIALALAIIGFALVAIIGVLPFGLNVQKENREETIIVQDANYFLDALRTGARGLDDLTNYVESITNYSSTYVIIPGTPPATNLINGPITSGYTYTRAAIGNTSHPENVLTNGQRIIGLLSTPRLVFPNNKLFPDTPLPAGFISNYVFAYVRALNGPAVEKAPQTNATVRDLTLRYRLVPEISSYSDWNLAWVDFNQPGLPPEEINIRSNAWRLARSEQANLNEVRLLYRWPINSRFDLEKATQRQVFRTLAGGTLTLTNHRDMPIWLMQPATYQAAQ